MVTWPPQFNKPPAFGSGGLLNCDWNGMNRVAASPFYVDGGGEKT
jgi:hypothetical protein